LFKYLQGINGGCHLFPALAVKDKSAKPSDKISMEILNQMIFAKYLKYLCHLDMSFNSESYAQDYFMHENVYKSIPD
jgi:hypothetical protein